MCLLDIQQALGQAVEVVEDPAYTVITGRCLHIPLPDGLRLDSALVDRTNDARSPTYRLKASYTLGLRHIQR